MHNFRGAADLNNSPEPEPTITASVIGEDCTVIALAVFAIANNITRKAIMHGKAGQVSKDWNSH